MKRPASRLPPSTSHATRSRGSRSSATTSRCVEGAFLDDERVTPQAGNFYGGWITAEIEGPFKGESGTEGW